MITDMIIDIRRYFDCLKSLQNGCERSQGWITSTGRCIFLLVGRFHSLLWISCAVFFFIVSVDGCGKRGQWRSSVSFLVY